MTCNKFTMLLTDSTWNIVFDDNYYNRENVMACLLNNLEQWSIQGITFDADYYTICVGFNSLQYFLYTILASILNIKIIFASAAQIENLHSNFPGIKVQYVISPRGIRCSSKLLHIDFLNFEYTGNFDLSIFNDKLEQAHIVFCTSGTTGKPKLVQYQEKNLLTNADTVGNYLGLTASDVCLCMFPTNYMYGFSMLFSMLMKQGTVILERSTVTPMQIVEYLNRGQITVFPVLRDLIDKISPHISSDSYYPNLMVINAADKIYKKHLEKILSFCPVFWNNFGQTESGPRLFAIKITLDSNLADFCCNDVVAIGAPVHKDILVSVRDDFGYEVERGVIGNLHYQTSFGMDGYLMADGSCGSSPEWNSSGDIVYLDENGMVFWTGRKSQSIKINGTFVNINLLHRFFDTIDEIKDSYFLYDECRNEIYGYFVIDSVDEKHITQIVSDYFRREFPQYPRLSQIHFLEKISKTVTGKIDMQALKQLSTVTKNLQLQP